MVERMNQFNLSYRFFAKQGDPMYIKSLNISHVLFRSKLSEYLSGLREIRHENINPFIGCYTTPFSFSLMYEYCSRGCLQVKVAFFFIQFSANFHRT